MSFNTAYRVLDHFSKCANFANTYKYKLNNFFNVCFRTSELYFSSMTFFIDRFRGFFQKTTGHVNDFRIEIKNATINQSKIEDYTDVDTDDVDVRQGPHVITCYRRKTILFFLPILLYHHGEINASATTSYTYNLRVQSTVQPMQNFFRKRRFYKCGDLIIYRKY